MRSTVAVLAALAVSGCGSDSSEPSDEPRSITTGTLAAGVVGDPYEQVIATDCPDDVNPVLSVVSGGLPAGLAIDGMAISGTPTAEGTFTFTLGVSCRGTGQRGLTIVVGPTARTLFISEPAARGRLPDGTVNALYTFDFEATGGSGAYTWELVSTDFTGYRTFDAPTGKLRYLPTNPGDASFTVRVTSGGETAQATVLVTAVAATSSLGITSALRGGDFFLGTAPTNVTILLDNAASGGTPPYTWEAVGFPGGLTFTDGPPRLSGFAPLGDYTVVFTVTDATGAKTSRILPVNIITPMEVGTIPSPFVLMAGMPVQERIPLSGGRQPYSCPLTYSPLPPGLTIVDINGVPYLEGTPTTTGTWMVMLLCTDSSNLYERYPGTWYQERYPIYNFEVR